MHLDDSRVALAVKPKDSVTLKTWLLETLNCSETKEALQILGVQIYILSFPDKRTSSTQSLKLKTALRELITRNGFVWSSDFETTIPKNWERHEDMIILPLDSFHHSIWKDIPGEWYFESIRFIKFFFSI